MTLSQDHEDIVDDVREAFFNWKFDNGHGEDMKVWMIMEGHMLAAVNPSWGNERRRADGYINLNDGHPFILLEVGRMKDGKWNNVRYATDGKPARVLRVGFDRIPHALSNRHTEQERTFYAFLDGWLTRKEGEND